MGRPEKDEHEKLSETVRLRLTLAEHEHVRAQARDAGLSVSSYLRRRACGYVVPEAPRRRGVDPAAIAELNRLGLELKAIGNNANQLALSAHTHRRTRIVWEGVVGQIEGRLGEVDRVLAALVEGVASEDESDDGGSR